MRRVVLLVMGVLLLAGCSTTQRELAKVAKEWCSVIRAAQVIPVYPLTEDAQPGDIYLVQMPIDKQQEAYRGSGYLPLDNHIARLNCEGYKEFYKQSFGLGDPGKTDIPKHWLTDHDAGTGWASAPHSAFPSYAFSVDEGGGFSAAIPVQGVPIGLSLLGSHSASGSVTIADARTYGVDMLSLTQQVKAWSEEDANKKYLSNFAPQSRRRWFRCWRKKTEYNYVRVLSRVYVTGRLIVNVMDTSSASAGVTAGAPKPVELLTASSTCSSEGPAKAAAADYASNLTTLSKTLEDLLKTGEDKLLPGATLKVVSATSNSITFAEDFIKRPLVIGYLGFDMPILKGGVLGPPIPTHALLQDEIPSDSGDKTFAIQIIRLRKVNYVKGRKDHDVLFREVARLLGDKYVQYYTNYLSEEREAGAAFSAMLGKFQQEGIEPNTSAEEQDRIRDTQGALIDLAINRVLKLYPDETAP